MLIIAAFLAMPSLNGTSAVRAAPPTSAPTSTSESASAIYGCKTQDNVTTADVAGKFSLHGVTKTISVPVTMTFLKDKLKARTPGKDGDLLVIRANFKIKRSDFGINPGQGEEKVSDDIELNLSIAGAAPRG